MPDIWRGFHSPDMTRLWVVEWFDNYDTFASEAAARDFQRRIPPGSTRYSISTMPN
jgi:hypothetical protein